MFLIQLIPDQIPEYKYINVIFLWLVKYIHVIIKEMLIKIQTINKLFNKKNKITFTRSRIYVSGSNVEFIRIF